MLSEYLHDFFNRITIDPEQSGRKLCIRSICIRVSDAFDHVDPELSNSKFIEELPDLQRSYFQ